MTELGPFAALRIILILLVVYYVVRWYNRSKQQQREQRARNGRRRSRYDRSSRHGDVTVEYNQDNRRRGSSDTGEYVDFEEVE